MLSLNISHYKIQRYDNLEPVNLQTCIDVSFCIYSQHVIFCANPLSHQGQNIGWDAFCISLCLQMTHYSCLEKQHL